MFQIIKPKKKSVWASLGFTVRFCVLITCSWGCTVWEIKTTAWASRPVLLSCLFWDRSEERLSWSIFGVPVFWVFALVLLFFLRFPPTTTTTTTTTNKPKNNQPNKQQHKNKTTTWFEMNVNRKRYVPFHFSMSCPEVIDSRLGVKCQVTNSLNMSCLSICCTCVCVFVLFLCVCVFFFVFFFCCKDFLIFCVAVQ